MNYLLSLLNVALNLFNTPCLEDYLIWYLYNHAFLLILILYMIHTGFILSLNLKHIFCRYHIVEFCFFISSNNIFIWIMKFNLWTFFICFQIALLMWDIYNGETGCRVHGNSLRSLKFFVKWKLVLKFKKQYDLQPVLFKDEWSY